MAMESSPSVDNPGLNVFSPPASLVSASNDNQHLHGVEVYSLYVDGARIHIDRRSVRVALPRHLMKPRSGEVNVTRVKEAHHTHRMMRGTHDWSRWSLARRWSGHWLLNVRFIVLHRIFFGWWCWGRRWWAHVWFCFDPALDARATDWIAAFLKFKP